MTAFESQPSPPVGNEGSGTGRITVAMRGDGPRGTSESDGPVSPWLYIAGALVTLAALYAVNFSLEDSGFAFLTYVLAVGGYAVSFFLRVRGVSLRGLQVPLLTLLGFFFLLSLLFGRNTGSGDSPSHNLQIALTWVAILHAYTLTNNAAVLFACVPGMTLIALVSTSTTEVEAQNAFLVFFCAATFLLIHENYLRTQSNTLRKTDERKRPVLFGSQFALAAGCFVGAMVLAHATVVPLQFFGERLFPQGTINAIKGVMKTSLPSALSNDERTNVELASGPISATEVPVLEVRCDEPLYWRGGTFDYYTGHSFKNSFPFANLANQSSQDRVVDRYTRQYRDPSVAGSQAARVHYQLVPDSLDLLERDMKGSHAVKQHFKTLQTSTSQIYGASRIKDLYSPVLSIKSDNVGGLNAVVSLLTHAEYDVVSIVPTSSPERLQAAPADLIPSDIAHTYLQRATQAGPENPVLAQLAAEWTRGLTTNYDKVVAIRRNIAERCSYNLNTPAAPADRDRVEYFLTESKQGYCDSFGAAMTMMCRYAGIPARLATGFIHGDETSPHTYIVKDKDRHIWTEVFFAQVGWVAFDATEGANDITASTDTARKGKSSFFGWLTKQGIGLKAIELIVLSLLIYLVKTELIDRIKPRAKQPGIRSIARPPGNTAILVAYSAAVKMLARKDLIRSAYMTTVEFNAVVNALPTASAIGTALAELTDLHDRYYYGMETAPPEDVQRAQNALGHLKEALRPYKAESKRTSQSLKRGTV